MDRPTLAVAAALGLLLVLAACNGSWSGYTGSYTGTLTETYSCAGNSIPPFSLSGETVSINVDGKGVAQVTFEGCANQTVTGQQTGDTIILNDSNTFSCIQSDPAGDSIAIFDLGGSIEYFGTQLKVNLTETATIGGATCSGTALGQLE